MEPEECDECIFQYELRKDGVKQLARVENFLQYHPNMNDVADHIIRQIVSDLWDGDEAILFKEKINFKLPGGGGFLAHQDSVAYMGMAEHHISVMIVVDSATIESK